MKKLLLLFLLFNILLCADASEVRQLPYKDIKNDSKIMYTTSGGWTNKVKRKDSCYIRNGQTFQSNNDLITFDTGCDYLFITDGRLIGFSNDELKLYEFVYDNESIKKSELDQIEAASVFREFHVIPVSEFSTYTNVCKLKKRRHEEKYLILNDTDTLFENYGFTTNNAKIETYPISGAVCVIKKGLIQFSKSGDDTKNSPWFILLVR